MCPSARNLGVGGDGGGGLKIFTTLRVCMSANGHEKTASNDFGVINIFECIDESQIRNLQILRTDCSTSLCLHEWILVLNPENRNVKFRVSSQETSFYVCLGNRSPTHTSALNFSSFHICSALGPVLFEIPEHGRVSHAFGLFLHL